MKVDDYYNKPKGCEHKAFLILILGFILFALLLCCEREKDFCWECESVKLDRIDTCEPIMKREVFELCYKTEEWIRLYENANTYIICDNSSMLKCTKQ